MKIEDLIKTLTIMQKNHPGIEVDCCLNDDWTGTLDKIVYAETYDFTYGSRSSPTCIMHFSK